MHSQRLPQLCILSVCTSLFFAQWGCATEVEYAAKPVPAPISGDMPRWMFEQGVGVGADPYVEPERQEAFFGLRLGEMSVLPVQLLIRNDSDSSILVRPYEVVLLLPEGLAVAPVSSGEAVARGMGAPVEFSPLGHTAVGGAPLVGAHFGPRAYGGASALAAVEGTMLLSELNTERELYRQLVTDYRSKELGEVVLKKNEARYGFVYFILPLETVFPSDVKLAVRVIDNEDARSSVVEVSLGNLNLRSINK